MSNRTPGDSERQELKKPKDYPSPGQAQLPSNEETLGTALFNQYWVTQDLADLETALEKFQEAVNLTVQENPKSADYLHKLARCFRARYQRLADLNDLEAALRAVQEAVDHRHISHPHRGVYLGTLSAALKDRYYRLGDLDDLERALQNCKEIVELTPEGDVNRKTCLKNLAICESDFKVAVKELQRKTILGSEWNPDRDYYLHKLIMLRARHPGLEDLDSGRAALQIDQEAANRIPTGHPGRANYLEELLFTQYHRPSGLNDINMVLKIRQELVYLTPEGHRLGADRLEYLALSFMDRYKLLGDLDDLGAAVENFKKAANFIPMSPRRPWILHNLASALRYRYGRLEDVHDLDTALQITQEAVSLIPEGHPGRLYHLASVSMCFRDRYQKLRRPEDLRAMDNHYDSCFKIPTSNPKDSWKVALNWASAAEEFQSANSITAYFYAFRLLPEILWIGNFLHIRQETMRQLDIGQVTSAAVRTCIDFSRLTSAVEIMEQGLGIAFQQMLQLRGDFDELPHDQANKLQLISSRLYSDTSLDRRDVALQRQKILEEVRQQPGLEYFLLPKPYKVLRNASQGGPIVILSSHKDHCDGIIIKDPTSDPVHVPLPSVTQDILRSQQKALREILGHCSVRARESESTRLFAQRELFGSRTPEECFADLLAWLHIHVVSPVYQLLESHGIHTGKLWWLPTGSFTRLPLHASAPTTQFIQSYTATLGSLLDAYAKKSSSAPKVGVVGVTHTGDGSNYLPGVEQEVQKIISIVQKPQVECLNGAQATVDAVKLQLQDCSWIHLACHGKQDLLQPPKSHLLLYGGILELETILQIPLSNSEFVFLAACQTAMGDAGLVNESFHLGGGFLAAGFRGAIGTMWSMNDQDGPVVAELVYSHLFRNGRQPQATDVAEALQLAVEQLKARKVPYERWIPFIHMGV